MAKEKAYRKGKLRISDLRNNVFNVLNASEKELLQDSISYLTFHKGENIIKQGTYLSSVFYVNNGLARMCIEGSNGKNIIISVFAPGELIGLVDLYSEKYYRCSVIALTPVELYFFDAELFRQIARNNAVFATELLIQQGQVYELLIKKIANLGTKQMHGRLADVLLYLSKKEYLDQSIFDYLSRTDLAELTGMSKENGIRLLSEFKNDGIITIEGRKIIINNYKLLERLSLIG